MALRRLAGTVAGDFGPLRLTVHPFWPCTAPAPTRITIRRPWARAGQSALAASQQLRHANLDKGLRLRWADQHKYGRKLSLADLLFSPELASEADGLQDFRIRRRPLDVWEPEELYWGPSTCWATNARRLNAQLADR